MVKTKSRAKYFTLTVISLIFLWPLPQAVAKQESIISTYEITPVLATIELVEGIELVNPLYTIDSKVHSDGFMIEFTVKSDFGTFHPKSPTLLTTTLVEIAALEELGKFSKSDLFLEGFERTGKEIGKEIKTLATEPVKTVKGAGAGIGRFFNRTYRATKTGVQKIGDKALEQDGNVQIPSQNDSKIPGESGAGEDSSPGKNFADASAAMVGNTTINILGYSEQRRQIAKQLDVDPYTTNKVLSEKLDEVAWAAFSGSLGIKAIKMVVPASMVLSATTTLTDWVWDISPGDLRVLNETALLSLGVSQEDIDLLLRHRWYTLTLQGRFVRAMEKLDGVENITELVDLALTVRSLDQARFVVEAIELLLHYHVHEEPIAEIKLNTTVTGISKSGTRIIPTPLDYVSWTKALDKFSNRKEFVEGISCVYLRGRLSPIAKTSLSNKGWQVREDVLSVTTKD